MTAILAAIVVLLFSSLPALAAEADLSQLVNPIVTPKLSDPISTTAPFATDRFLTNAGVSFPASAELVLEPELGIGYRGVGQELHGGIEQSTHRLHAQAGWRLSLSNALYFAGAAKFSVLTVETRGMTAGEELGTRPEYGYRNVYEFNPTHTPRWTGELGLHLTPRTDLMLYYDQDPVTGWSYSREQQEERLGTRFIFRFK